MARILAALALFAIIAPIHLLTKALLRRSRWPSRFLSAVAWAMGARVEVKGEPVGRHTLIVANHTSWLDILIRRRSFWNGLLPSLKQGLTASTRPEFTCPMR